MKTSTSNVLTEFLTATAPARAPRTRQRDAALVAEWLHCLDHLDRHRAARHLGTQPAELLVLEREFGGPDGAFFRVFGVDELVCCLPEFLEPAQGTQLPDRGRIALAGRLLRWIARRGLVSSAAMCAFYDAEGSVRMARQSYRAPDGRTPGHR